jgi:hypothetical protein
VTFLKTGWSIYGRQKLSSYFLTTWTNWYGFLLSASRKLIDYKCLIFVVYDLFLFVSYLNRCSQIWSVQFVAWWIARLVLTYAFSYLHLSSVLNYCESWFHSSAMFLISIPGCDYCLVWSRVYLWQSLHCYSSCSRIPLLVPFLSMSPTVQGYQGENMSFERY